MLSVSLPAAAARRPDQLPQPLRPAAGAALSVLSRRAPPLTGRTRRRAAVRAAGVAGGAAVRAGFSTVFVAARRHGLGARPGPPAISRRAGASSPASSSSSWACISSACSASACSTARRGFSVDKPVGLSGAYVMGLAFAFGWTPCIGPVLAAILAVAGSEATRGARRAPAGRLFARARHSVPARGLRHEAVRGASCSASRAHLGMVEKVMGVLLVLTGVAFLTGWITSMCVLAAGDLSGAGTPGIRAGR